MLHLFPNLSLSIFFIVPLMHQFHQHIFSSFSATQQHPSGLSATMHFSCIIDSTMPYLSQQISPPSIVSCEYEVYNDKKGFRSKLVQPSLDLGLEMTGGLNSPTLAQAKGYNHHMLKTSCSSRLRNNGVVKRNARAPRMRWTTTLHAHFVHAVQLLGGHERATTKSVLDLMNVNDLTLAHVKSHLQMYRTVKSTDKGTGQSDVGLNFRRPWIQPQKPANISPCTLLPAPPQTLSSLRTKTNAPLQHNHRTSVPSQCTSSMVRRNS